MRISDWSSDVCSSDLLTAELVKVTPPKGAGNDRTGLPPMTGREVQAYAAATVTGAPSDSVKSYFGMRKISTGVDPKTCKLPMLGRKRVVSGKDEESRSVRVGRRIVKKNQKHNTLD